MHAHPHAFFVADADGGVRAKLSTAVVIAEVPTGWWDEWDGTRVHGRGDEYEAIKGQFEAKLKDLLMSRFPQLVGKVGQAPAATLRRRRMLAPSWPVFSAR